MDAPIFTIFYWGSHPKHDEDCHGGEDHSSEAGARRAFLTAINAGVDYEVAYVEIKGPGVHEIRKNPRHDARRAAINEAAEVIQFERRCSSGAAGEPFGY